MFLHSQVAGAPRGEIAALAEVQVSLTSFGHFSKLQSICVARRGPRNLRRPDRAAAKPIALSLPPHLGDKTP